MKEIVAKSSFYLGKKDNLTGLDRANIISTKIPNTFLYKSMASNELLSHVIGMQYQYDMPLYVME